MFTIVTLSYNQSAFLRQAIESVLQQRREGVEVEYVVVDPGSTDGSREILSEYGASIDQLILEKDSGPAAGLRKGLSRSSGKLLGFLNSDDWLLPGALRSAQNAFLHDPKLDVYLSRGLRYDERSSQVSLIQPSSFSKRRFCCGAATFCQPSTFFRSSAYRIAGGINAENKASWDGELLLQMHSTGARFAVFSSISSVFRVHDNSITNSIMSTMGSSTINSNSPAQVYRKEMRDLSMRAIGRIPSSLESVAWRGLGIAERSWRAASPVFLHRSTTR
jgi:glycosyltransferase involved in cell wall biosynthesis